MNTASKLKECAFIKALKYFLSSRFFPFLMAGLSLLCYFMGWDLTMICVVGITGTLILLLLEDASPIITVFLFMSIVISYENSPSPNAGSSEYYFRTGAVALICIVIAFMACAALYRMILAIAKKRFKITPIFIGFATFSIILLLNGIFSENHIAKDFLYGFLMMLCFFVIYILIKDSIMQNNGSFVTVAYGFAAFALTLITEVLVVYATADGIMQDGWIDRSLIRFGWGVYNTMGMFLVMCVPFVLFLAGKEKYGWIFTLLSAMLFVVSFMSCSRQAIVGIVLTYPVCAIYTLVKGKNRISNICVLAACLIGGGILVAVFKDIAIEYFKDLFKAIMDNGELSGSGRMRLWKEAIGFFKSAPVFGVGFYVEFSYNPQSGLGFIPFMCHNTVLQLLSSCGIIGLIVYAAHRVQTVISYTKNASHERTYLIFTIFSFLIICLFDNHIFNIFPTILYGCLIAMLDRTETQKAVETN